MSDMRSSGVRRLPESSMMNGKREQDALQTLQSMQQTAMARYSQEMLRNTWKNSENARSDNISSMRSQNSSMGMNFSDFTKN